MPDLSRICFAVDDDVARTAEKLSDPREQLAVLTAYFTEQANLGRISPAERTVLREDPNSAQQTVSEIPGVTAGASGGLVRHPERWKEQGLSTDYATALITTVRREDRARRSMAQDPEPGSASEDAILSKYAELRRQNIIADMAPEMAAVKIWEHLFNHGQPVRMLGGVRGSKKSVKKIEPGEASSSSAPVQVDPVSPEVAKAIKEETRNLRGNLTEQRSELEELALRLAPEMTFRYGSPQMLVMAVLRVRQLPDEQHRKVILNHPHMINAMVESREIRSLLTASPHLADKLVKAPAVLQGLISASTHWWKEAKDVLGRDGLIEALEKDPALIDLAFREPIILKNLAGHIETFRVTLSARGVLLSLLRSPRFAAGLLASMDPVETLWSILPEAALISAIYNHEHRREWLSSGADLYRRILDDESTKEFLREYSELNYLILFSPAMLDIALAHPDSVEMLSQSPDLAYALEENPDLAYRLLDSPDMLAEATKNAAVAEVISAYPHAYDELDDEDLLQELRSASSPPRLVDSATTRRYTPGKMHENLDPHLLESLRRKNFVLHIGLATLAEGQHPDVRADFLHLLERNPEAFQWPHQLRRAVESIPADYALPANDSVALAILQGIARYSEWELYFEYPSGYRDVIDNALKTREDVRRSTHKSPVVPSMTLSEPRAFAFFATDFTDRDPLTSGAIASNPSFIWSPGLRSAGLHCLDALSSDDSAPLRLLNRHRQLVSEFTREDWLAVVSNLTHASGVLSRLTSQFGRIPAGHWRRLLTDGELLKELNLRKTEPTARALMEHSEALKVAISRDSDFVQKWRDGLGQEFKEAVDATLRPGISTGTSLKNLTKEIRKLGPELVTQDGFQLDRRLTSAVEILVNGIRSKASAEQLKDDLKGVQIDSVDEVIQRYSTLRDSASSLQSAVRARRDVAQAVFFSRDILDLFERRPSILGIVLQDPNVLRQLTSPSLSTLPRQLIDNDHMYRLFISQDNWRIRLTNRNFVDAASRNRTFFNAVAEREYEIAVLSLAPHQLLERSASAAQAAVDSAETIRVLARPESAALIHALSAADERVVRAVVASQGRLGASARRPELVRVLEAVPGLAEALGERPDLLVSDTEWAGVLGNAELVEELASHPQLVGEVLTPAALPVVRASSRFVRLLGSVPDEVRRGLLSPEVLQFLHRNPSAVAKMARNSSLPAVLANPRVAQLVKDHPRVWTAIEDRPELADVLVANKGLRHDLAEGGGLWEVAVRHPALGGVLSAAFRSALRRYPEVRQVLIAHDGVIGSEAAERVRHALTRPGIMRVMKEHPAFAARLVSEPLWQDEAISNPAFSDNVGDLARREQKAFQDVLADPEPGRLLERLRQREQQQRDARPAKGQASGVAASGRARRTMPATPATGGSSTGTERVEAAPQELTDLLAGAHGRDIARTISQDPVVLALLSGDVSLADDLVHHPERLSDLQFGAYLERNLPPLSTDARAVGGKDESLMGPDPFEKHFAAFLQVADAALTGPHYGRASEVARVRWNKTLADRKSQMDSRRAVQAQRLAQVRANMPGTWQHSGEIVYLGGLKAESFDDAQRQKLEQAAQGQGVREPRSRWKLNTPLHIHTVQGSGGAAIVYLLDPSGFVRMGVYAVARTRLGNQYRWDNTDGKFMDGPPELDMVANDPVLLESRSLVDALGAGSGTADRDAVGNAGGQDDRTTGTAAGGLTPAAREAMQQSETVAEAVTAYHDALERLALNRPKAPEDFIQAGERLHQLGFEVFAVDTLEPTLRQQAGEVIRQQEQKSRPAPAREWAQGPHFPLGAVAAALAKGSQAGASVARALSAPRLAGGTRTVGADPFKEGWAPGHGVTLGAAPSPLSQEHGQAHAPETVHEALYETPPSTGKAREQAEVFRTFTRQYEHTTRPYTYEVGSAGTVRLAGGVTLTGRWAPWGSSWVSEDGYHLNPDGSIGRTDNQDLVADIVDFERDGHHLTSNDTHLVLTPTHTDRGAITGPPLTLPQTTEPMGVQAFLDAPRTATGTRPPAPQPTVLPEDYLQNTADHNASSARARAVRPDTPQVAGLEGSGRTPDTAASSRQHTPQTPATDQAEPEVTDAVRPARQLSEGLHEEFDTVAVPDHTADSSLRRLETVTGDLVPESGPLPAQRDGDQVDRGSHTLTESTSRPGTRQPYRWTPVVSFTEETAPAATGRPGVGLPLEVIRHPARFTAQEITGLDGERAENLQATADSATLETAVTTATRQAAEAIRQKITHTRGWGMENTDILLTTPTEGLVVWMMITQRLANTLDHRVKISIGSNKAQPIEVCPQ